MQDTEHKSFYLQSLHEIIPVYGYVIKLLNIKKEELLQNAIQIDSDKINDYIKEKIDNELKKRELMDKISGTLSKALIPILLFLETENISTIDVSDIKKMQTQIDTILSVIRICRENECPITFSNEVISQLERVSVILSKSSTPQIGKIKRDIDDINGTL